MTSDERWLSVEEIAGHLGISKEAVYPMAGEEKIHSTSVGKLWKFRASEVDAWVIKGGAAEDSHQSTGERMANQTPEQKSRDVIDQRLKEAGWIVQQFPRTRLDQRSWHCRPAGGP
jgi:excisionase family DNA binding protein